MKIVCDNCATKYSIADEKVRGKVFKIRCKKCSHIIVVKGTGEAAPAGARDTGSEQALDDGAMASAEAGGEAVWHLVIDREQVGPMTVAEVRGKFGAGEIDAETYAWREGFGDWLRLGSIDDFRDLAPAAPGGGDGGYNGDYGGAPAQQQQQGGDLFGGVGDPSRADMGAYDAAAQQQAQQQQDVFAQADNGAANLFGAPTAQPAGRRSSSANMAAASGGAAAEPQGDAGKMTGQRNENSVLFSLNNLQALATGGGGSPSSSSSSSAPSGGGGGGGGGGGERPGYASAKNEGSGLIDIRAMAASTLGAGKDNRNDDGGGGFNPNAPAPVFSPVAPMAMMPMAETSMPKWVWAVIAVGGVAIVALISVAVIMLTRRPDAPPAVAVAPPTAPAAPVGTTPTPPPVAATGTPTPPPTAAPAPTEAAPAADKGEDKSASSSKGSSKKDKKAKIPESKGGIVAPPSESKPEPKKKSSGGGNDALDDLLAAATGDKGGGGKKKAAAEDDGDKGGGGGGADDNLPEQLGKSDIQGGMGKVKGRVAACYEQYKVPGMVQVSLTIGNNGKISRAESTGSFAGTPTGDCVAKAVKSATFGRFKGTPQTIMYPFILR